MPVAYIDLRAGLSTPTKQLLVRSVAEAVHAAYHIEDTRVFLRESSPDQTSVKGVLEGMEAAMQAHHAQGAAQ